MQPIQLSDDDIQALRDLEPNLKLIITELERAEKAGLNVTNLRQRFQTVINQHQGLITHYVNVPQQQRRRTQ